MSPEILGVIVGGVIGMVSSLAGALPNHFLTLRRDKKLSEENNKKDRAEKLTEGVETFQRHLPNPDYFPFNDDFKSKKEQSDEIEEDS